MYRILFFLFFCCACPIALSAQELCCSSMRALGNKAFEKGNFERAIELYKKGQKCGDGAQCPDLATLISKANKAKANASKTATPKTVTPKPKPSTPSVSIPFKEPEMVYVEGSSFQMGSNDYDNEKPIHSVTLSSFSIGKYEVTQALWRSVMGKNPSNFKGDNLPVEQVSWDDIQRFLQKLNAKTGKNYRLPTEAEWEYAARGGNKSNSFKFSGSNTVGDVAWYGSNSDSKTHTVGGKTANELGIYDMSGNVWEWCSDRYDENYYKNSPSQNPKGATSGSSRVLRGGSWYTYAYNCRVANRLLNDPSIRDNLFGFRVCRND